MNKTTQTILIGILIVSSLLVQTEQPRATTTIRPLQEGIIYVDDNNTNGPWDGTSAHPYQHIQDAIENATTENTIYLYKGIYTEHITIGKTLTITGEQKNSTIIDGEYAHTVMSIQADHVTITNLTIRNSGGYTNDTGIMINAKNSTIADCIVYQTKTGIHINKTQGNLVQNCMLYTNGEGIYLDTSKNTNIERCSLFHNAIGLHLEFSSDMHITYTNFHTNGLAVFGNNSTNITIDNCNVSDNSDNHGGIIFCFCSHIILEHNVFRHNGMGVNLGASHDVTITNCDFLLNTHFAIILRQESENITISKCIITQNFRFGIYIIENSRCVLTENNIEKNTLEGLYVDTGFCDAQQNFWGSFFGPAKTEIRKTSTIKGKIGSFSVFPWKIKPVIDSGAKLTINGFIDETTMIPPNTFPHLQENDSDGDGTSDAWEIKYGYDPYTWNDHTHLDPDCDGLNNIEECCTDQWGSNPFEKDIFVEIDWMKSKTSPTELNKPSQDLLDQLVAIFKEHNITLHVDSGELGGGEEIPYESFFSFSDMRDYYWEYFLHNNLTNPRKDIFHYGIICDYGPDVNFPFMGWDNLDSFLISAQWIKDLFPTYNRPQLIVGAIVHQLGSTLGLLADTYGGNDNLDASVPFTIQWLKYHNYKSCMNYYYKYKLFSYSDGTHGRGDFNDWEHLKLGFFKQSEFPWPKTPSA